MVESAITLVVHVFVSQDIQDNTVKQDCALKVSMESNATKGVPVICQILTGKLLEISSDNSYFGLLH